MPTISLNLPLVDFAAYIDARLGGHDTAKIEAELSKQIVDASHNVGMFDLTGHGVKRELIEQVMAVNAQFFASTDEQKQAISTRVSLTTAAMVYSKITAIGASRFILVWRAQCLKVQLQNTGGCGEQICGE